MQAFDNIISLIVHFKFLSSLFSILTQINKFDLNFDELLQSAN